MRRYDGTNALIVGGTSGIGLATARLLVAEGGRVLVTGRPEPALAAVEDELGEQVVTQAGDATKADDVSRLFSRAQAAFGRLDLLFVNAGANFSASLEETTEAQWDEVMGSNAKGPFFIVQRLVSLVADGGAVVLTTSVSDVRGLPNSSLYSASKAALRSMTRTFAAELLPRGIRVNAVSPGPIDTGILDRSLPADQVEQVKTSMRSRNPMHRFGEADEVARAVAFLAFDATFTTGAELPVDGGVMQL